MARAPPPPPQARIQDSEGGGGFVQEFRLENRSFSLRMQVIIANDYVAFDLRKVTIDLKILEFIA